MEAFTLRTIQQIVESGNYPFSLGQLRHYLMYRHKNGLDRAVRKIGKRLYLRLDYFNEWIESQSERGHSSADRPARKGLNNKVLYEGSK